MILDIMLGILSWCMVGFVWINLIRQRCATGTRGRYIFATVQWSLAPLALAYFPLDAIFSRDSMFLDVLQMINLILTLWILHELIKDDDDNWWKRKRKQLKRYLSSLRLTPALAGSRA